MVLLTSLLDVFLAQLQAFTLPEVIGLQKDTLIQEFPLVSFLSFAKKQFNGNTILSFSVGALLKEVSLVSAQNGRLDKI